MACDVSLMSFSREIPMYVLQGMHGRVSDIHENSYCILCLPMIEVETNRRLWGFVIPTLSLAISR